MGLINRPTKLGGNNTYVAEVAAGFTIIRANEVDGDFNIIYDAFDGNISNDNIDAAAAIAYSKLDLTDSIVNADIAAGAAIGRGKLAQNSVASAVTAGLLIADVETALLTTPISITAAGGTIIFLPSTSVVAQHVNNELATCAWRWKRGGRCRR